MRQVGSSVSDVDLAVLVTDASEPWEKLTRAEMDLIEQFKKLDLPAVAVLNKIDLLKDKEQLIPMMAVLNEVYDFQQIVPLSAKTGDGVALLRKLLHEAAIEGPHYFDDDMLTDQPERVIAAEMLREKALCFLSEEIPHGIAVTIETMKEREGANGPVIDIDAVIYCERKSHKPAGQTVRRTVWPSAESASLRKIFVGQGQKFPNITHGAGRTMRVENLLRGGARCEPTCRGPKQ